MHHPEKKKRPLWEDAQYSPQPLFKRLYNKKSTYPNFSCADYTIIEYQEKSMDPNNKTLIAKLEQSRARLNAVLDKISPQEEIYPSWKLKQLLDHITGWDELTAQTLRQYLTGEPTDQVAKRGIDQYNADSIATRKSLTLQESRQAYEQSRQAVLQVIGKIPASMLTQKFRAPWGGNCTVSSVVKIFASHELEHARHLEESLPTIADQS
jgi:hypothetical protein